MILESAPTGFKIVDSINRDAFGHSLLELSDADGRELVIADGSGELHVRLRDAQAARRPAVLVPLDGVGELTIDPAYFSLTGGIERWLYRVARKHAGRQPRGWLFEFAHLHAKSGSQVRVSDFALQIRRIAARQPLPGYKLRIEREARRELLRILPAKLSTAPVDSAVEALGTSHA